MTRNLGAIDRALRVALGVILIALAVTGVIGPWGYLGLVPLGTAAIGWCPAYLPFGVKTCRRT
jgi:nicotinamide mononucleotide (NMN) deamidase PncC